MELLGPWVDLERQGNNGMKCWEKPGENVVPESSGLVVIQFPEIPDPMGIYTSGHLSEQT